MTTCLPVCWPLAIVACVLGGLFLLSCALGGYLLNELFKAREALERERAIRPLNSRSWPPSG